MFPSFSTPDSNDQPVIKLCSGLIRINSFESGVEEEGNIENMQGSGTRGPELRNTALHHVPQDCRVFLWHTGVGYGLT